MENMSTMIIHASNFNYLLILYFWYFFQTRDQSFWDSLYIMKLSIEIVLQDKDNISSGIETIESDLALTKQEF